MKNLVVFTCICRLNMCPLAQRAIITSGFACCVDATPSIDIGFEKIDSLHLPLNEISYHTIIECSSQSEIVRTKRLSRIINICDLDRLLLFAISITSRHLIRTKTTHHT